MASADRKNTMDVSRIEAFKPSIINWKNLTAREIIKYKSSGIEVPNIYYQWAISFLNDVENARKDDVTYQSAKSASRHTDRDINGEKKVDTVEENTEVKSETEEKNVDAQTEESAAPYGSQEVMENPKTEAEQEQQEKQILTAKETREKMEQDGNSIWRIARTFRDISVVSAEISSEAELSSSSTEDSSNSEIETLESEMNSTFAQIEEIKSRMMNLKNKKNDTTVISEIRKLNQQLKSLGINAQAQLAGYDTDFENFDVIISDNANIGDIAIDFGGETIDIGREIPLAPWFIGFANSVISAGEKARDNGEKSNDAAVQALSTNNDNISTADSYKEKIKAQTGIGAVKEEEIDIKDDKTDPEQIDHKTKEADKEIKTAQNDGTDTTDKLHLNIDEILKRKIRRGQNVET